MTTHNVDFYKDSYVYDSNSFYMNCILLLVMKINIFKQYLFIREKIEQRVESPLNIHTVSKVER